MKRPAVSNPFSRSHSIAIFPCIGLGDGLISNVLAHNLALAGHKVTVYHPILPHLQPLFPNLSFSNRPDALPPSLDHYLFFYEKLPWMQTMIESAGEKATILNPIATPNTDYPYWEEGEFDGRIPFAHNLVHYLKKKWEIKDPILSNGIKLPPEVIPRKYPKRVIIHPTSSRPGKNWSQKKFLQLANRLNNEGYEPSFILTKDEQESWPDVGAPKFTNLCELAAYIAESGSMIGNDSGIGHLASCLGIPTLTICRSQMSADFWRPAFHDGEVVVPPRLIPNIKGLRLRDQRWQAFVSTTKVIQRWEMLKKNLD